MDNDGLEELVAAGIDPATAIVASEEDSEADSGQPAGCLCAMLLFVLLSVLLA